MTVLLELLGRTRVYALAWLPWTEALFAAAPPTGTISEYAKHGLAYLANMGGVARGAGARTGEAGEVTWAGCILWGLRPQNLMLPSRQAPRRQPREMDERYFKAAVRACPPTSCPHRCQRHDNRCESRRSTL